MASLWFFIAAFLVHSSNAQTQNFDLAAFKQRALKEFSATLPKSTPFSSLGTWFQDGASDLDGRPIDEARIAQIWRLTRVQAKYPHTSDPFIVAYLEPLNGGPAELIKISMNQNNLSYEGPLNSLLFELPDSWQEGMPPDLSRTERIEFLKSKFNKLKESFQSALVDSKVSFTALEGSWLMGSIKAEIDTRSWPQLSEVLANLPEELQFQKIDAAQKIFKAPLIWGDAIQLKSSAVDLDSLRTVTKAEGFNFKTKLNNQTHEGSGCKGPLDLD